jgi:hypothetical protein
LEWKEKENNNMEQTIEWPSIMIALFILCIGGIGIYFLLQKADHTAHLIVFLPKQDLPAYTQIPDDSLIFPVRVNKAQVSSDMVLDSREIIGAYLIETVKANTVIRKSHIAVPPSEMLTCQTRVVSLQVPPAIAWHGEMAPGEMVSVLIPPQTPGEKATLILTEALVLKSQVIEPFEAEITKPTYFVTLVVPDDHFRDIVILALSESIVLVPNEG